MNKKPAVTTVRCLLPVKAFWTICLLVGLHFRFAVVVTGTTALLGGSFFVVRTAGFGIFGAGTAFSSRIFRTAGFSGSGCFFLAAGLSFFLGVAGFCRLLSEQRKGNKARQGEQGEESLHGIDLFIYPKDSQESQKLKVKT